MYVKTLKLKNFRNYEDLNIELNPNINIIYGNNAQGKTNLLESIYFLGLGKSHRSIDDKELIRKGSDSLSVYAECIINDFSNELNIKLINNRKKYIINKTNIKSLNEYVSNLKIIIFFPEDLEMIKNSPELRRKYFNIQISQLNKNYLKILTDYTKLLKIRNDMLKKYLKTNYINMEYFDIITKYLIDKASYIYSIRNKYINKVNEYIGKNYKNISNYKGLFIKYVTNIDDSDYTYEKNKTLLEEKFIKIKQAELKSGSTLIGPHKDDYEYILVDSNLKKYGSQGQQRMAILALKLSEIEIFKKETNDFPILLLDDVFSELDEEKKNNLLKYINKNTQTIITTTDLNNINKNIIDKSKLINIENGKIVRGE